MPFEDRDAVDLKNRMRPLTRVVLRVFGRRLNRDLFYPVLGRAYERGVINSHQLHALHHHFDPTQSGAVGQVIVPGQDR